MEVLESVDLSLSAESHWQEISLGKGQTAAEAVKPARPQHGSQSGSPSKHKKINSGTLSFTKEDIAHVVHKVREFVDSMNTKLSFSYDREAKRPIIYVVDKNTDKIIRQIPPEEMVQLIRKMDEIRGIIFQGKA